MAMETVKIQECLTSLRQCVVSSMFAGFTLSSGEK
jgi:hypothetical protein